MLRTRDYFVLVVIITFLLVAIGSTIIIRSLNGKETYEGITLVPESESEFAAVIDDQKEVSRSERLALLKQKIEEGRSVFLAEPEPVVEQETPETEDDEVSSPEQEDVGEMRCATYSTYAGAWNTKGLIIKEIEGLRLVYRETSPPASPAASTSTPVPLSLGKDVLLELPVRSVSLGGQNCIPSDVIGITLGGALIRNTDAQLYAPTAENTLLGYALDGYPIYGTSAAVADTCGGRTVAGKYRYQLKAERETILNCYVATPARL